MEIKHEERMFYARGEPLQLQGEGSSVKLYRSGEEVLFFEKGKEPDEIIETLVNERGVRMLSNWQNRFQLAEGPVEWEERKVEIPGLLVRYAGPVDIEAHSKMLREHNGAPALLYLNENTWNPVNSEYYSSRRFHSLRKDAFTPKGEGLEKDVPRVLEDVLTATEGLVVEVLTPEGLQVYSPNSALLQNALSAGVMVGVSSYELTDMAIGSLVYQRLKEQLDAPEREAMKRLTSPEARKTLELLGKWAKGELEKPSESS